MEAWQINISLIPSIAVILTSANRLTIGLTDEINVRLLSNPEVNKHIIPLKVKQLKRLSMAVFLMYLSLSILIVNALLAALGFIPEQYDKILIIISILLFLGAVYLNLRFAYHAYFIRQQQFNTYLDNLKTQEPKYYSENINRTPMC